MDDICRYECFLNDALVLVLEIEKQNNNFVLSKNGEMDKPYKSPGLAQRECWRAIREFLAVPYGDLKITRITGKKTTSASEPKKDEKLSTSHLAPEKAEMVMAAKSWNAK